jgi:hypothetical protein
MASLGWKGLRSKSESQELMTAESFEEKFMECLPWSLLGYYI